MNDNCSSSEIPVVLLLVLRSLDRRLTAPMDAVADARMQSRWKQSPPLQAPHTGSATWAPASHPLSPRIRVGRGRRAAERTGLPQPLRLPQLRLALLSCLHASPPGHQLQRPAAACASAGGCMGMSRTRRLPGLAAAMCVQRSAICGLESVKSDMVV